MNYSKHCDLCKNKQMELKNGLICSLTNKKPDFKIYCTKIDFSKDLQQILESVNIELEVIKKDKISIHLSFYLFSTIGTFIIFGGISLLKSTENSRYAIEIVFLIISLGISIFTITYHNIKKYRRKLHNAKFDKYEIDSFLKKYRIEYTSKTSFNDKVHGTQQIDIEINFFNKTKKSTRSSYNIDC